MSANRTRTDIDIANRPASRREGSRAWLDAWARVGPLLAEDRWRRLTSRTDDQLREDSLRLMELWQRDWQGDDGLGLMLHQRIFQRARERR